MNFDHLQDENARGNRKGRESANEEENDFSRDYLWNSSFNRNCNICNFIFMIPNVSTFLWIWIVRDVIQHCSLCCLKFEFSVACVQIVVNAYKKKVICMQCMYIVHKWWMFIHIFFSKNFLPSFSSPCRLSLHSDPQSIIDRENPCLECYTFPKEKKKFHRIDWLIQKFKFWNIINAGKPPIGFELFVSKRNIWIMMASNF